MLYVRYMLDIGLHPQTVVNKVDRTALLCRDDSSERSLFAFAGYFQFIGVKKNILYTKRCVLLP